MDLKHGDKVFVIDERLEGEIVSIQGNKIRIACADGFEYEYLSSQLFKVNDDNSIDYTPKEFKQLSEEHFPKDDRRIKPIKFVGEKPIFDIHIEELAPTADFASPHEKLLYQLSFVREVLSEAARKRVKRMVFVHGVGKGKLREELRKMLREAYPQIEFFDGSYVNFGAGATEIIIHRF